MGKKKRKKKILPLPISITLLGVSIKEKPYWVFYFEHRMNVSFYLNFKIHVKL